MRPAAYLSLEIWLVSRGGGSVQSLQLVVALDFRVPVLGLMKSEMSESSSYSARIKELSSSIVSCVLLSQCDPGCRAECRKMARLQMTGSSCRIFTQF